VKGRIEIKHGQYSNIKYSMFERSHSLQITIRIVQLLVLPLVLPFIVLAKLSPKVCFRMISELFSLIPFSIGEIVRYDFYRYTLRHCGQNVFFSFGTVFYYPDITIGNNVLIGMYNTIHHCNFGNDVMTAEGCRFLSGSKYHSFERKDIPMAMQGGKLKRIAIGSDVWIGSNCVIMEDVCDGSIVGAGSVVTKTVEPYSIVAGNPAKLIRKRS
jgi:acetyltransferase-like isoleucine patch superfamily enzyme